MKLSICRFAVSALSLISVAVLSALVMYQPAEAQEGAVYKWVDEDGTTHYTDRPPVSGDAELLSIQSRRTNNGAVQARLAKRSEATEVANLRDAQQAEDASAEKDNQAQIAEQRRANCQQARGTLTKYDDAHILYKPLADGEREYLTDDEIDAARLAARESVKEWCGE